LEGKLGLFLHECKDHLIALAFLSFANSSNSSFPPGKHFPSAMGFKLYSGLLSNEFCLNEIQAKH
jgi:hypothetical protein